MIDRFNPSDRQVYNDSKILLGEFRTPPLIAFSTEEHLQRTKDAIMRNPSTLNCCDSLIIGGNDILDTRRDLLEFYLRQQDEMHVAPRASALELFFRVGFGLVERTVVRGFCIDQAEPEAVSIESYEIWQGLPQRERIQGMDAYLKAEEASLLARNLLEPNAKGTMINYASHYIDITIPRVTEEAPYHLHAAKDYAAREQVIEGALAALYLLREHHIAQEIEDGDDMDPFQKPTKIQKPPELPPDYYIG